MTWMLQRWRLIAAVSSASWALQTNGIKVECWQVPYPSSPPSLPLPPPSENPIISGLYYFKGHIDII